jgi:addiction module HigA family antidote
MVTNRSPGRRRRRVCGLSLKEVMAVQAIHPGEQLAEELTELNMSAAGLARNLGVPTNRITEILNGRRSIRGGTALRLGALLCN